MAEGEAGVGDESFLNQAKQDAEKIRKLSEDQQNRLRRETDWSGYRMRGYEFPTRVAAS